MIRDIAALPPTPAARAEAQPARQAAPTVPAAPEPRAAGSGASIRNPHLRIELALNLVVLEFRDAAGEVRNTIPSPREIAAYRSAAPEDSPASSEIDLEG
jgi:hypothetical protein